METLPTLGYSCGLSRVLREARKSLPERIEVPLCPVSRDQPVTVGRSLPASVSEVSRSTHSPGAAQNQNGLSFSLHPGAAFTRFVRIPFALFRSLAPGLPKIPLDLQPDLLGQRDPRSDYVGYSVPPIVIASVRLLCPHTIPRTSIRAVRGR